MSIENNTTNTTNTNRNTQKIDPKILNQISDTLFIPLYMRAKLTMQNSPILKDESAVTIVEKIDYDFSRYDTVSMSLTGCGVRADYLDKVCVQKALESSKKGKQLTAILIGCGLDDRFGRVTNSLQSYHLGVEVDFYEMDLAEVMRLREKLLPAISEKVVHLSTSADKQVFRQHYISGSLLDNQWLEHILNQSDLSKTDFIFLIEGVLMYFEESTVKGLFLRIADTFEQKVSSAVNTSLVTPQITLAFDTTASLGMKMSRKHDAIKHTDTDVTFKWAVDDNNVLTHWHTGYQLQSSEKIMYLHPKEWSLKAKILRRVPMFGSNSRILVYNLTV